MTKLNRKSETLNNGSTPITDSATTTQTGRQYQQSCQQLQRTRKKERHESDYEAVPSSEKVSFEPGI